MQSKKVASLQSCHFLAQGRKKYQKNEWKGKLKLSPYLSVFGRNLQKRVFSILTNIVDGETNSNSDILSILTPGVTFSIDSSVTPF
jgi:hypothetical protein